MHGTLGLKIERIIPDICRKSDTSITSILLSGNPSFSAELNSTLLNSSIDYILSDRLGSTFFTKTWFVTKLFIIFVFQLNKFTFLVLFYPHFIFLLLLFSFFPVYNILLCLDISIFTFYVSVICKYCFYRKKPTWQIHGKS